jgi:mannose-6-phosphate isomerase-like protein (cupin superfamily)
MAIGEARTLPRDCDVIAPDGSEVRVLATTARGSAAHFLLQAGQTAAAVRHRTVEEIWYVLSGAGEIWRSDGVESDIARLAAGVCLTIPVGTAFQFRCTGEEPLAVFGVTMPPWPGASEAELVEGPWTATGWRAAVGDDENYVYPIAL